ncbi:hypothetical protein D3C78_1229150 [compost metagenome]
MQAIDLAHLRDERKTCDGADFLALQILEAVPVGLVCLGDTVLEVVDRVAQRHDFRALFGPAHRACHDIHALGLHRGNRP